MFGRDGPQFRRTGATAWHSHPVGQTLHVTVGRGVHAPAELAREVVNVDPP